LITALRFGVSDALSRAALGRRNSMSWFESLALGLVQGLTEFLPVSSSAHLRLTAAFSGWKDPGAAFTAITQLGTEAAVLICFRRDVGRILSAWFRSLTNKKCGAITTPRWAGW
jgi:undecaprenyl pyrophosphate phosphatase UppP